MILFLTIRTIDFRQNFSLAGDLLLKGLEFIFFIGVSMGLYFLFVMKTVLITQCDVLGITKQCLYRAEVFSALHPTMRSLSKHKELRGVSARTADPK